MRHLKSINFQNPKHLFLVIIVTSSLTGFLMVLLAHLFVYNKAAVAPAVNAALQASGQPLTSSDNKALLYDCAVSVEGSNIDVMTRTEKTSSEQDCQNKAVQLLAEACGKLGTSLKKPPVFKVKRQFASLPAKKEDWPCMAPR